MVLISRRRRDGTAASRSVDRTGILMAIGCAAALGLFLVALDYGGRADPLYTVTVARTTAALTLLAVAAVARPVIRLRRRAIPGLLVVGLLIVAANLLFTSATTFGDTQHRRRPRVARPRRHHGLGARLLKGT